MRFALKEPLSQQDLGILGTRYNKAPPGSGYVGIARGASGGVGSGYVGIRTWLESGLLPQQYLEPIGDDTAWRRDDPSKIE